MKISKYILLVLVFSSCKQLPERNNEVGLARGDSSKVQKPDQRNSKNTDTQRSSNKDNSKYKTLYKLIQQSNLEELKNESYNLLLDNPKDIFALNALGMYYYRVKQLQAAELLFSKAMALSPDSAVILNNIGVIKLEQGRETEALTYFQSALQKNSNNEVTNQNLTSYYLKSLDFNSAIQFSKDINISKLSELDIQCQYGIALMSVGQFDQSRIVFERILSISPDHVVALLNFAILEIEKNKKYKEGLDLVNRLKLVRITKETETLIKTLENQAIAGLKSYERTK